MNTIVKTGCTLFYMQTAGITDSKELKKQRSRFTAFLPDLMRVQLVWVFVKVVPFILVA